MKKIKNKVLIFLMVFLSVLALVSCDDEETKPTGDTEVPTLPTDETDVEDGPYVYEGTPTVAPYTIYNEDGSLYRSGYNNMFDAIRAAGDSASSSNVMYVVDANKLKIFERQAQSQCWCFDGTNFVGSKPQKEALAWGRSRQKSYVINGRGTAYVLLGAYYYKNSEISESTPFELNTGAYNYMFTRGGEMVAGQWEKLGFGYLECNVRLSEATYTKTAATDGAWNVYIFLNAGAGTTSDLGLIGVVRDGKMVFALVRNCGHPSHKAANDGFKVFSWDPVTSMEYDPVKGVYCGADDLKFQCWQTIDGFKMDITNLTTGKVYTIEEKHTGMFEDKAQYMRFLLAASYVPEVGDVWNARNQGSLRNVIFDNVYVARFNPTNVYTEDMFEEFYPGSPTMHYGFSQGGDCASMIFDTYEADGTYSNGQAYHAGEKYISYSVYYDGGNHYHKN